MCACPSMFQDANEHLSIEVNKRWLIRKSFVGIWLNGCRELVPEFFIVYAFITWQQGLYVPPRNATILSWRPYGKYSLKSISWFYGWGISKPFIENPLPTIRPSFRMEASWQLMVIRIGLRALNVNTALKKSDWFFKGIFPNLWAINALLPWIMSIAVY